MHTKNNVAGLAMVELLVVGTIVAILISLGIPAFAELIDRNRLKAATEVLYSELQLAKAEAIKRNTPIRVTFTTSNGGATWCYGMKENAACDCTVDSGANLCHLDNIPKVIRSSDFPGVNLRTSISSPGDRFTFEGIRGITSGSFGKVILTSKNAHQTRVIVSRLARVRYCSPAGDVHVAGYSTSC